MYHACTCHFRIFYPFRIRRRQRGKNIAQIALARSELKIHIITILQKAKTTGKRYRQLVYQQVIFSEFKSKRFGIDAGDQISTNMLFYHIILLIIGKVNPTYVCMRLQVEYVFGKVATALIIKIIRLYLHRDRGIVVNQVAFFDNDLFDTQGCRCSIGFGIGIRRLSFVNIIIGMTGTIYFNIDKGIAEVYFADIDLGPKQGSDINRKGNVFSGHKGILFKGRCTF